MSDEIMVQDSVAIAVLVSGLGGTVLAFAIAPWVGLVPSIITALIYAHRVWNRRKDRQLREENERLRKLLEEKDQS